MHPAALLVFWSGFALFLQWTPLGLSMWLGALCLLLSLAFAPRRSWSLLRRTRWLLLSLALLFVFFTPGEYLPGIPGSLGITHEGLEHAGGHLSRLLALLSSLALLHEGIGTRGLLSGLYWLLGPFGHRREATVVRLMLVLDYVEQKEKIAWREWLAPGDGPPVTQESLSLARAPLRPVDKMLIGGVLAALLGWLFVS